MYLGRKWGQGYTRKFKALLTTHQYCSPPLVGQRDLRIQNFLHKDFSQQNVSLLFAYENVCIIKSTATGSVVISACPSSCNMSSICIF